MANFVIQQALVEQIQRQNCALFLGAGLPSSATPKLPLDDLVEELIARCNYHGSDRSLTKVAEYYQEVFDLTSLLKYVSEWIDQQGHAPTLLDQVITRLPINTIITTRMDLRLENAYLQAERPFLKIIKNEEVTFTDTQRVLLIKIHGSVDQRDTLILTERDHFDLTREKRFVCDFINLIHGIKTILYLEYDLNNTFLKWLHHKSVEEIGKYTRKAYAVWPDPDEYVIRSGQRENIEILDSDPLRFLLDLERELSARMIQTSIVQVSQPKTKYRYPYKFLDYFDTDDTGLFFGREEKINELSSKFLTHRFSVLFGDSGVGKTSLIKAGFMPKLKEFESFPIYSRCLDSPLMVLEKAIIDASTRGVEQPAYEYKDGNTPLLSLLLNCQQFIRKPIVLFIDQFEELFRLPYLEQQEFMKQLAQCLEADMRLDLKIVISLRKDFFSELIKLRTFLPFIYLNVFEIEKLPKSSAKEAIIGPLGHFDVTFDDDLVATLLDDLRSGGTIAPAQLQIVCSRLYDTYAHEKSITVTHYRTMGEASTILGHYLEEVINKFNGKERQQARQVLQALVSANKTKKLLSGPEIALYLEHEWQLVESIVTELENYRLLRKVEVEDIFKYELAHEYLVNQVWQWLSDQEAAIKEAQELLDIDARYWPKYNTTLNEGKLQDIYQHWQKLVLDQSKLELLFRSSVTSGYLKKWNEVADSLKDKGVSVYRAVLQDLDAHIISNAQSALARLGEIGTYATIGTPPHSRDGAEIEKTDPIFDVFLSYNAEDRTVVKEIARQLLEHGIKPWLDLWEVKPGTSWQRQLEMQFERIRSAVVFIGAHGIETSQDIELDMFLREFINRDLPVIPVLLPGAPPKPQLPLFLRGLTWIDFRAENFETQDTLPLEGLIWGIRGGHTYTTGFDVFLCHTDESTDEVLQIAQELKAKGIIPWLDEWELIPGKHRQRLLKEQVEQIKVAACFISNPNRGPWDDVEINTLLREFIKRGCPVIPVILASYPKDEAIQMPYFLMSRTWVDFRSPESNPIERLVYGITGEQNSKVTNQNEVRRQNFDVFFCYNEAEGTTVKQIGQFLEERGIIPWLDEWALPPGVDQDHLVEEQIKNIKTAIVFIGQEGLGTWQREILDALLIEFLTRNCHIILAFLPNATELTKLPIYLETMPYIDFRKQDSDPLEELLREIKNYPPEGEMLDENEITDLTAKQVDLGL